MKVKGYEIRPGVSIKITIERLAALNACSPGLRKFREVFGSEIEVDKYTEVHQMWILRS